MILQAPTLDITSSLVTIDVADAQLNAFLAQPEGSESRPAVIVVHEIFGLTDHIKDVACRFARAGFTALAPDLFKREGALPLDQGFDAIRAVVGNIPDARLVSDLNTCAAWLRALPGAAGPVGLVGFCWGGRVAMLMAGNTGDVQACVAYYGRVEGEKTAAQPTHPIDIVESINSPLMGHFGGLDHAIPVEGVRRLKEALKSAGKTSEIFVYDEAGHAFNNDTREQAFHAESAAIAMHWTQEWFKTHLY
jgi:carboxymethylenebutenolidase